MKDSNFWREIISLMDVPFEMEDVSEVEESAGTVWITMRDGEVFYLNFQKCPKCGEMMEL